MEALSSIIGKHLNLPVVDYSILSKNIMFRGKNINILCCESNNFLPTGFEEYTLNDLCTLGVINYPTYEDCCYNIEIQQFVNKVILFDFIIFNTDRHANNIVWYGKPTGELYSGDIFDNGYAMLFDDINNLLSREFDRSTRMSNINAFYNNFNVVNQIVKTELRYNNSLDHILTLDFDREELLNDIFKLYDVYKSLDLDREYNVIVDKQFFLAVFEFICYRVNKLKEIIELVED